MFVTDGLSGMPGASLCGGLSEACRNPLTVTMAVPILIRKKCIKCGKLRGGMQLSCDHRPGASLCGPHAEWMQSTPMKNGKADIDYDRCVSCGQCLVNCPFGAISDKSQIFQVIRAIRSGERVYAALAPAFVGQFGPKVTPGKLRAAMKELGFADVFEVAIGRGPLCGSGSGRFCGGSSGASAVYGDLLLSGVVFHGQKAFPGLCKLHLHGADTDDSDGASDQAGIIRMQKWCLSAPVRRRNWKQCVRTSAVRWISS